MVESWKKRVTNKAGQQKDGHMIFPPGDEKIQKRLGKKEYIRLVRLGHEGGRKAFSRGERPGHEP